MDKTQLPLPPILCQDALCSYLYRIKRDQLNLESKRKIIGNTHNIHIPDSKSNNHWITFMKELDKLTFRCKMYDSRRPKIFRVTSIIPITGTRIWNKQKLWKIKLHRVITDKSRMQFWRKLNHEYAPLAIMIHNNNKTPSRLKLTKMLIFI